MQDSRRFCLLDRNLFFAVVIQSDLNVGKDKHTKKGKFLLKEQSLHRKLFSLMGDQVLRTK